MRAIVPQRVPRAIHLTLVALTLWAHLLIGQQAFANHLNAHKAAAFAWDVIAAEPNLLIILGRPILSVAILYALYFWLVAVLAGPRSTSECALGARIKILLATWIASSWLLLLLHSHYFPRSVWSWWVEPLFAPAVSNLVDVAAAVWISWRLLRLLHRAGQALSRLRHKFNSKFAAAIALVIVVIPISILAVQNLRSTPPPTRATTVLPNVVIIGLDSLRRDVALGRTATEMPNLARFRERAFVHENVVSPLARTFPAWVTILTGQSPAASGARDNLVAQEPIDRQSSLGWKLKSLGYRTIYATDETRFSNIGRKFGFDSIISPQPGAADFLISQFADQPLVNFAVQLPLAEYALPSLVGNRAFAQAYRPQRFIERLARGLGRSNGQPTAIAVHLCLAHWPYYSARLTPASQAGLDGPYQQAVAELDMQFGELTAMLRRLGYLDDQTLVVVLADHGEGLQADKITGRNIVKIGTEQVPGTLMGGHGSTLLEPSQWQIFLMFAGNSTLGAIPRGTSSQLASLQDVAPSVLALLGDTPTATRLNVIDATRPTTAPLVPRRFVSLETGFRPRGFDVTNPDGEAALRIASSAFNIRADGRIEMKPDYYREVMLNKDFGVTDGSNSLSLVQTGNSTVLVYAQSDGSWRVFPSDRPDTLSEMPPLLDAACSDTEMRPRLQRWCSPATMLGRQASSGDSSR